MNAGFRRASCVTVCGVLSAVLVLTWSAGCGGGAAALFLLGSPLFTERPTTTGTGDTGGGGGTTDGGGFFGGGGRTTRDPCEEANNRKFVTISMRNQASLDFIHYFLLLVAFVDTDAQSGAVCQDDINLYTDFGYSFIPEGSQREFGDYCIEGPALLYFHESGNFRLGGGTGTDQFASAISPAQGNTPTFDSFFDSAGAMVPVPNQILFHNPGTGEGAALQVAPLTPNPCSTVVIGGATSQCSLDAFYYVDENDRLAGTTALGPGSARRVPNEIQGTGCLAGFQEAFASLAPSGTTASTAQNNEFLRGGRIEFVFIRQDLEPPIPQLLWRVTDASGVLVHDFDPRADIP
jgi:hypothetical protein